MVFILPGALAYGIKMIPDTDQPGYNSDARIGVYGLRTLTQKFIAPSNNLTAIGTSIRNPNLSNKKSIILSLYDIDGNLIRTSTINGLNVPDGEFVKFVFDPIADSKGKTYTFTLASPNAGSDDQIAVFYIGNDSGSPAPNWIVEYTYDQKIHQGGLPMVTFYKPSSHLEVVKMVYSGLLSRVLSK